jgi:hypothetical protein
MAMACNWFFKEVRQQTNHRPGKIVLLASTMGAGNVTNLVIRLALTREFSCDAQERREALEEKIASILEK